VKQHRNFEQVSVWGQQCILALSSLQFALQRLETLLATPPAIHPASKLTGILANFL
jgi:hypothetical protein